MYKYRILFVLIHMCNTTLIFFYQELQKFMYNGFNYNELWFVASWMSSTLSLVVRFVKYIVIGSLIRTISIWLVFWFGQVLEIGRLICQVHCDWWSDLTSTLVTALVEQLSFKWIQLMHTYKWPHDKDDNESSSKVSCWWDFSVSHCWHGNQ